MGLACCILSGRVGDEMYFTNKIQQISHEVYLKCNSL